MLSGVRLLWRRVVATFTVVWPGSWQKLVLSLLPFTSVKFFGELFSLLSSRSSKIEGILHRLRSLPPTLFVGFGSRFADLLDLWSDRSRSLPVTRWGLVEKKMSGARGCFNCGGCAWTLSSFFPSLSTSHPSFYSLPSFSSIYQPENPFIYMVQVSAVRGRCWRAWLPLAFFYVFIVVVGRVGTARQ